MPNPIPSATLSRKTWLMAFDELHLLLHLEWVRSYYHFALIAYVVEKRVGQGLKQISNTRSCGRCCPAEVGREGNIDDVFVSRIRLG